MSLSKKAERTLLDAVQQVVEYVDSDGMAPTDAVIKVASELRTPPAYLPLLVQAYNQGQATVQRGEGFSVLEKIADYPLAVVEDVQAALYPAEILLPRQRDKEAQISDEYTKAPARRKVAATASECWKPQGTAIPLERDPDAAAREKISNVQRLKQAAVREYSAYTAAKTKIAGCLDRAVDYFRQLPGDRMSFEEFEYFTTHRHGELGKLAANVIYEACPGTEKRADKNTAFFKAASFQQHPLSMAAELLDASREALKAHAKYAEAEKAHTAARSELLSKKAHESSQPAEQTKSAAGLFGGMLGGLLSGATRKATTSAPLAVDKAESSLSSPEHMDDLRLIEAQATFHELQNDEVIGGYEPEDIASAYNEITSLSPRAALQPAILRPLLRKRLTSGSVEPFEAQQIAELEKTMKQTAEVDKNVLKAPAQPASVLG